MRKHKFSWFNKILPEDRKSVFWSIIGTLILIFLLQPIARDIWEKPDIAVSVQQIVFSKEINAPEWELTFIFRTSNSGQAATVIEYKSLEISFPYISQLPHSFSINATKSIEAKTIIYDTLKILIPKFFDSPSFKHGQEEIYSPANKRIAQAIFDTSNVEFYYYHMPMPKLVSELANRREDIKVDSLSGYTKMQFVRYRLNYKGKTYDNWYYPPGYKISHYVIGDRIRLTYTKDLNVSDAELGLAEPRVVFIPAEAIKEKIDFPRNKEVLITQNVEENNAIKIKYYKFPLTDDLEQHFYIFRD